MAQSVIVEETSEEVDEAVDEGVVDEGVVDDVVVDDGVVEDDVVVDLENPDVIFYTTGGGAEDFGAADQAAELAVEQAADRALERIDIPAVAPTGIAPTKKD